VSDHQAKHAAFLTATEGSVPGPSLGTRVSPAAEHAQNSVASAVIAAAAAPEHILQFFTVDHLPAHLQDASRPFLVLSERIMQLPRSPERTVALRKLLESKDAAVRAALAK
jgi:hypothetical protein